MGAVTGSSKQPVILSGSDIRDILTTLTQDRRATTPPAHLRVTTSTCLHRLLTELARKLQCFHLCTQRVRDSAVFLYNADMGLRSNRAKTVQGIQMWFFCPSDKGSCVQLWYHMYGKGMGTLNVYQQSEDGKEALIFSQTGDQGLLWRFAQASLLPRLHPYRVSHKDPSKLVNRAI